MLSIVGVLVYSVGLATTRIGSGPEPQEAAYVAMLHFLLPFGVAYTISTNSPANRPLIAIYSLILYAATLGDKGYLGGLPIDFYTKVTGGTALLILVAVWLFRSPKMRYYYALVAEKPIPVDLLSRAAELAGQSWLSAKSAASIEWIMEHLETIVLIGFIIAAIYALVSTG